MTLGNVSVPLASRSKDSEGSFRPTSPAYAPTSPAYDPFREWDKEDIVYGAPCPGFQSLNSTCFKYIPQTIHQCHYVATETTSGYFGGSIDGVPCAIMCLICSESPSSFDQTE